MFRIIRFDKLWAVMKERNISKYKLNRTYGVSNSQIQRLREYQSVTTYTLSNLCKILNCRLEDIAEYIPDPEEET